MFSDGGISSNFPIHLFDGLIPQWPTFGIDLEAKPPGHSNMVFLPQTYLEGIADRWMRFDQQEKAPSRMGGFLTSIVNTMQNWNDNTLSRMSGVRDRVVRVRLADDEGGLNPNMPATLIQVVAARGGQAAQELIKKFLGPPPLQWLGRMVVSALGPARWAAQCAESKKRGHAKSAWIHSTAFSIVCSIDRLECQQRSAGT
jgi:hypothetical protein